MFSVPGKESIYEGDNTLDDQPYQLIDRNTFDSDSLWVYDHEKLKISPIDYHYKITDTNGLNSDLCVRLFGHFPGHSLGTRMRLSKSLSCEKYGIVGTDFWELFNQRDLKDDDITASAKFVYHRLIMNKYSSREKPYTDLNGSVYLLGLWLYKNDHLFFQYLDLTRMENGQVNLLVPKSELKKLFKGGHLIYGYDIENKKFGVIVSRLMKVYM